MLYFAHRNECGERNRIMQCTRCAKPLPEGVRFCLACGFPVNAGGQAPMGNAPMPKQVSPGVPFTQAATNSTGQAGVEPAQADFAFQEFSASPVRPAIPPAFVSPGNVPGYPGATPGFAPPGNMPGYPGTTPAFAPPGNMPGYPGIVPSAFPPGSSQGMYPPPMMPVAAPVKPKRRGRSVGCIVLYAFLAIALLFGGLCVTVYEVGTHALGNAPINSDATKAAATQLYQQVTSQAPAIQDPLAGSSSNLWETDDGCILGTDGWHAHVSDTGHFTYCLDTANFLTNVAFQVQMQILTGDAGGLAFRATTEADSSTGSLYFFQVTSSGSYTLYLDTDTNAAKISSLASGTTQAMDTQAQQTNTLAVITKGNIFDLYINRQFVVQVEDATLATGGFGVLADDHTNATDVLYTNAQIWDLDK